MAQKTDGTSWFNTDYNTTEGTDFWVTFLRSGGGAEDDANNMNFYVVTCARQKTQVEISNPSTSYKEVKTILPYKQTSFHIPNTEAYMETQNVILNRGICIRSLDGGRISAYATSHHKSGMYDATNILPAQALEKSYVIQNYLVDQDVTEFALVATQSFQTITIYLHETTYNQEQYDDYEKLVVDKVKDTTIVIGPMNTGQTFLYRSSSLMSTLSGTQICSTNPVAVFYANQNTAIQGTTPNHLFSQGLSTDKWGKNYIVTSTYGQNYDIVRITAVYDNTVVFRNSLPIGTLKAFETLQDTIITENGKTQAVYYYTSHITECFLYTTCYDDNSSELGAPVMTPIIPQELGTDSLVFATFNELESETYHLDHYVNIVANTKYVSNMKLVTKKGVNNIGSHFIPISGSPYSYAEIKLESDVVDIINSTKKIVDATFTARVYGLGKKARKRESYAYAAGSRVNRSIDFLINDQYIKEKTICINQSLKFTSIINGEFESRLWDFGDMDTRTDSIVPVKKWDQAGDYTVSLLVTKKTPLCENIIVDTVKALIHVREEYKYKDNTKHCKGDTYTVSGLNENGQIVSYSYTEDTKKTLSFKTSAGCDSIVELDIKFGEPDPKTDIVTYCDSYNWNGTNYTASGIYTHNRTNEFKCDVTDTLKLTIRNSVKGPETPITICQANLPYMWEGQSITKVGTYTAHLTAQNGCDSLATLIVSIEPAYRDEQTVWICPNDTYLWRGQVCQQAKDYESHGTSDCGCDSAFILHIKHYPTYNLSQEKSICEGEQFILGDTILSTSGTYKRTLQTINGCDSIVTLKLIVYSAEVETLNETICSNETYMFDGQLLHQTGSYTMTSQTAQGCGKTTVLNLTVLPTSEKWDTVTVCQQNLPYTYCSTKQATTAGDYKEILKNSNQYGCDSTYHLHLIVNPTLKTTLPAVYRCDYEGAYSHPNPAAKNMQNLTKSGIYKDTLTSVTGCDSVIVLPFHWGERTYYDLHVRVCQDELPWKDPNSTNQLWRDTTYNDTITNTQQCDSVITLHFSVAKVYTTTIDTTICEMEAPYNHPDITATNLQNLTTSGIYKQRIPTVDECDSTIILNLTIWPTTYRYENIIECENNLPYTYGEHQKKAYSSGIYRDTLINKNQYGCDSVLEVHLTVLPTIRDVQYDTICDSDVPYYHLDIRATRLQNLTISGVYYDTLKTISGCDSILELHLFVPHAYYGLTEEVELCDNDELYWNDLHLLGSWGVGDTTIVDTLHTIYGCDSVITLTVHIWPTYLFLQDITVCQDRVHPQWEWIDDQGGSHGFYPINVAGEFVYGDTLYSIHGCDSVFGVRLTVHPSYRFDSVYSICDNEQTTWQHKTYQSLSAGVYYDTVAFTTVDGCDSIFYLILNVHPTYEKEVKMTLCENELPYYFTYTDSWGSNVDSIVLAPNEQFRMITETQKDTIHKTTTKVLRTIYGCDSVVHFDITIHPSYQYVERGYICWDGYYEWRGNIYNESGVYFDSLYTDTWGCDSTYVLELFVKPVELIRIDTSICDNETLSHIDTLWYTQDLWAEVPTMVWEPGMSTKPPYWDIKFLGTDGCDSIVYRYYVDIHPTYLFKTEDTLCSNEFYALHNSLSVGPDTIFDPLVSGFISERDTIYIDSLVTINGCDSVYWLDAHICPHYLHVDYDTICDNESVTWREHTYSLLTAGNHTYQDVFPNLAGCDSIYELRLCVHPTFAFQTTDSMCVDEPYLWQYRTLENLSLGWHSYDTTYTSIYGCDSSFHLNLFVKDTTFEMIDDTICQGDAFDLHGVYYSAPGDYKDTTLNAWGCHHFTYLHLSVVPPTIYTLSVNNICADQLDLSFHYNYEGLPLLEYSIYFDSLGHAQGFHDVIHQPIQDTLHRLFWIDVPSGNPLPQPTPTYFDSRVGVNHYVNETKYAYPQPDIYTIRVVLHNGYCPDTLQDKDTTFTIFYPSWIHEQHWNDAIVLYSPQYNGGYEFSAQQWYYNDQPIVGQTGEYLYLPQWLKLNPDTLSEFAFCPNTYKVLLTRKSDGRSVFTCPICPVQMADTIVPRLDYYSVVPTLVSHEYPVVGILSSVAGEYTVTTSAGEQIKTGTFTPDTKNYAGSISLPSVADVYHVTLSSPKLDQRTCKVIVY